MKMKYILTGILFKFNTISMETSIKLSTYALMHDLYSEFPERSITFTYQHSQLHMAIDFWSTNNVND